ncbi:hypothetical protein [Denitratimonas sp. CY0512]
MGIKAQHLVNVSGGKDSTAVYLLAFDLFFQQQAGGGCTSDLGLCES